jgi:urease accessory protein
VQKALYPDESTPGMAHVILMSSSGGILAGDRMDVSILAESGTASRIGTQAATKIYKMNSGFATQNISITARKESYVEFLPHQIIPFRSSRFFQEVELNVHKGSTVVYSETLSAGRTASGEDFDFDLCFLKLEARNSEEGRLMFTDAAKLEPGKHEMDWLFGGKKIWSTTYVIGQDPEGMKEQVIRLIKQNSILGGCSILPSECGFVVRVLDNSIDRIRRLTEELASMVRNHAKAQSVSSIGR